jgi:leucyl aminopeptidase (aminopeptidase T)
MDGELPAKTRSQLARSVLQRNLLLRRGENLTVESWTGTLDLANAFVSEGFAAGLRPMLLYVDEETWWESVRRVPATTLGRVGSHEWAALRETNAYVYLMGPSDTVREAALPAAKAQALTAFDNEWFRLVEKSGVRSVRLDFGRINASEARRYRIDTEQWQRETIDATLIDPRQMHRSGTWLARALHRGHTVHVSHPNGTSLELKLRGRRPRVHDGVIDPADVRRGDVFESLPSGWVSVAVDEQFAEGQFVSNLRSVSSAAGGDVVVSPATSGGRWVFKDGRLTSFEYSEGGEEFAKLYQSLGPGKERPATLSVGLNPKIDRIPFKEDQHLGRISFCIGRNSFLDGVTHTPHFIGYLYLDGADLRVDDRLLIRDGKLLEGSIRS